MKSKALFEELGSFLFADHRTLPCGEPLGILGHAGNQYPQETPLLSGGCGHSPASSGTSHTTSQTPQISETICTEHIQAELWANIYRAKLCPSIFELHTENFMGCRDMRSPMPSESLSPQVM